MKLNLRCGKGVAGDKFDRLLEIITDKETLHHTDGIAYQTTAEEESCFTRGITKAIHETLHKKKRHRAYHSSSLNILPYRKKTETKDLRFHF